MTLLNILNILFEKMELSGTLYNNLKYSRIFQKKKPIRRLESNNVPTLKLHLLVLWCRRQSDVAFPTIKFH